MRLEPERAGAFVVATVQIGSPAETGGVHVGDVITLLNGNALGRSWAEALEKAGQNAVLTIRRREKVSGDGRSTKVRPRPPPPTRPSVSHLPNPAPVSTWCTGCYG